MIIYFLLIIGVVALLAKLYPVAAIATILLFGLMLNEA
jgi:hypothetical protein